MSTVDLMLRRLEISKRHALSIVIGALAIESVLLSGIWIAGEHLWDLDSASVSVRLLGYAGIYGHLIVDVLLGWLIAKVESYPVFLLIYGSANWIVLTLVIGFGCRFINHGRRSKWFG